MIMILVGEGVGGGFLCDVVVGKGIWGVVGLSLFVCFWWIISVEKFF